MRKMDPKSVVDDFCDQVDETMQFFRRAEIALVSTLQGKGDISILAENTFLRLAVAFEVFVSDLFLAYLNRNSSQFERAKEMDMRQSLRDNPKFTELLEKRMYYTPLKHIKVNDLQGLIDPEEYNVTFGNAEKMKARAQSWLYPAHASLFASITSDDELVINAVKRIRNHIAHRSQGSQKQMKDSILAIGGGNSGDNKNLGRGASGSQSVGSFLKASFGGERRVKLYAVRLKEIARKLRLS